MNKWRESFLPYTVCAACGICFGIATEKGQVHLPAVIRNQMTLSQFTMLKMFLPALASSCAVFSLLYLFPAGRNIFETVRNNFAACLTTRSIGSVVMGGTILGIGMTLAGSCPGMIFIQLGTGTQHAVYTFAGCITGTVLYSLLHSKLKLSNNSEKYLDELLSMKYVMLGLPLIGLLMTVTLVVDNYFPEKAVAISFNSSGIMSMHAWNPIICGMIVGSLQLPLALAVSDSLGGSSSYCTLIANGLNNVTSICNYFKQFLDDWWQVIFVGGAVLGGAISSISSGAWGAAEGVSPYTAFIGGICLLFGARLASGCTSGHGISGTGLLNSFSFLTVISMFGGAMGMAAIMNVLS